MSMETVTSHNDLQIPQGTSHVLMRFPITSLTETTSLQAQKTAMGYGIENFLQPMTGFEFYPLRILETVRVIWLRLLGRMLVPHNQNQCCRDRHSESAPGISEYKASNTDPAPADLQDPRVYLFCSSSQFGITRAWDELNWRCKLSADVIPCCSLSIYRIIIPIDCSTVVRDVLYL
ncbi:hypothetical protein J6590_036752 [Homalodisca vitripennis]|nr:hypothetical protein J6590_036752 [Homalodisca vitripennis]